MRRECRSVTQAAAPMMSAAPLTKVVVIWLLRIRNLDQGIALAGVIPRGVGRVHAVAQEPDGSRGGEPEKRREQRVLDQVLAVVLDQPPVPDVRHCLTSSCLAPGPCGPEREARTLVTTTERRERPERSRRPRPPRCDRTTRCTQCRDSWRPRRHRTTRRSREARTR